MNRFDKDIRAFKNKTDWFNTEMNKNRASPVIRIYDTKAWLISLVSDSW